MALGQRDIVAHVAGQGDGRSGSREYRAQRRYARNGQRADWVRVPRRG
jgi:hypothetical protein